MDMLQDIIEEGKGYAHSEEDIDANKDRFYRLERPGHLEYDPKDEVR